MCELRVNTFLLLFFFFFFFILTSLIAAQNCPPVTCGSKSFNIRFPFLLQGNQNQDCGYHGFHLSCSSGSSSFLSETVLKLPNSGDFFVRDISYAKQRINLSDPRNCLAKRLMRLNLSDSPYSAAYVLNFMFLNCSSRNLGFRPNFGVIDCLSDGKNTVLAISSTFWASYMISSYSCMLIETVPVPVSWPMKEDDGYIVDLNDNKLQLSWGTPDCRDCEEDGGTCGLLNYTRQEIGCFNKKTGDSSGRKIARIVSLSITVPALMCSFGIAFSRCCRNREGSEGNGSNSSEQTALQPTVSMVGLSEETIQSFKKMELGQSRRVTGPNDIVCPICLSEYLPKEILRCIPECNHCFHAECIDPWLRMNRKCPLCRNSPCPNA